MNLQNQSDFHDPIAAQWERIRDLVSDFSSLENNWDGEGSLPVRKGLVEVVLAALNSQNFSQPPSVAYLAPDGTVFLEWYLENSVTVANIREKGKAEVVVRKKGLEPEFRVYKLYSETDQSRGVEVANQNANLSWLDEGAYRQAA